MSKPTEFKSDTGKTIDDYRNIIKQLKVKVKKLQTSNEDLLEKLHNYETQPAAGGPHADLDDKATKIQALVKGSFFAIKACSFLAPKAIKPGRISIRIPTASFETSPPSTFPSAKIASARPSKPPSA